MTIPVTIDGVRYPSLTAAASAYGVGISTMQRAYHAGCPELAGKRGCTTPVAVKVNGVEYPSASAAARATGLYRGTIAALAHKHGGSIRLRVNSPLSGGCVPAQPGDCQHGLPSGGSIPRGPWGSDRPHGSEAAA